MNPAAADGLTRSRNTSWIIGEAMPSTPMPALTFIQRTTQRSQNWGVFQATCTGTEWVASAARSVTAGGVQPCGFHPGGGRR